MPCPRRSNVMGGVSRYEHRRGCCSLPRFELRVALILGRPYAVLVAKELPRTSENVADTEIGLRARKKLQTRQLIAATALPLFLERGFDKVHVIEIARACNVSEATVYNYFPTKEALVFDDDERVASDLHTAVTLGEPDPLHALAAILKQRTRELLRHKTPASRDHSLAQARRFFTLIEDTPSLRAHHRDSLDRLVDVAALALSQRTGLAAHHGQIQALALGLVALLRTQFASLHRHAGQEQNPNRVVHLVITDVDQACDALARGADEIWRESREQAHDHPATTNTGRMRSR